MQAVVAAPPQCSFHINFSGVIMAQYNTGFRRKHQFYLSILKHFGFGQRIMETRINIDVAVLIDQMRLTDGRPFDPEVMIHKCITNIICSILFGQRYSFEDPKLERLITIHDEAIEDLVPEVGLWPTLRFLPPFGRRVKALVTARTAFLTALEEEVLPIVLYLRTLH